MAFKQKQYECTRCRAITVTTSVVTPPKQANGPCPGDRTRGEHVWFYKGEH